MMKAVVFLVTLFTIIYCHITKNLKTKSEVNNLRIEHLKSIKLCTEAIKINIINYKPKLKFRYIDLKQYLFYSIFKYLITIQFKPKHTQPLPVGYVRTNVTATYQ
jgi:hypothetical protein